MKQIKMNDHMIQIIKSSKKSIETIIDKSAYYYFIFWYTLSKGFLIYLLSLIIPITVSITFTILYMLGKDMMYIITDFWELYYMGSILETPMWKIHIAAFTSCSLYAFFVDLR